MKKSSVTMTMAPPKSGWSSNRQQMTPVTAKGGMMPLIKVLTRACLVLMK